jgi:peptide/nickel transport system permease protein
MLRFILRRLLQVIPLLLGITFLALCIMQLAPGDYLTQMQLNPQVQPETVERLRRNFGLDQPLLIQYLYWLRNAVIGDFGYSFTYKIPVFQLIGQYVSATLLLAVSTLIFSWAVAIPLGIYSATHRNGIVDRFVQLFAFSGISVPGFFVALIALVIAQRTGWFPVGDMESPNHSSMPPGQKVWDILSHLVLPTLVLGTRGVAGIMRQMRGNLLDVLSENYITAARARGLSERWVILKHAVRNAINPLVTMFGYEISGLLGGAALVEIVMSWPGLGRLLLEAVLAQDLYVAMAAFLMGSLMLIGGNLLADILLAVTDPRIKYT